jgi:hypothetical protein
VSRVHVCAGLSWRPEFEQMLRRSGFEVSFSPLPEDKLPSQEAIAADLSGIERADILLVDLVFFDRPTAAFCVGYAVARGKSIIGLSCRDDPLSPWAAEAAYVVRSIADLEHAMRSIGERRRRVAMPVSARPVVAPTDRCGGCGAERRAHDAQSPHECVQTECEGFRENRGAAVAALRERRRELLELPEDWYIDHDGSHANRPTAEAVDKACAAAERALSLGLVVDDFHADANGGTCVVLSNGLHARVSLFFGNGGHASVVALGDAGAEDHSVEVGNWSEALSEQSWAKIQKRLAVSG